jgi:hypothetical protein
MFFRLIFSAAAFCCTAVAVAAPPTPRTPATLGNGIVQSEQAERRALVTHIVKRWGPHVNRVYGEDIHAWADRLVPTFRNADSAKLRRAAAADTFQGMVDGLLGQPSARASASAGMSAKSVPLNLVGDLVFTPVPSCNMVDTRLAEGAFGGPLMMGEIRSFYGSGPSYNFQGGSQTYCGIPPYPAALLLGVTVVSPATKGWLQIWPYATARPVSSSLSFGPTQNSRNDIIVKMSQGLTRDFSVMANVGGSHLLISVLGYYSAPHAIALDCHVARLNSVAAVGRTLAESPVCQAGYTATSGGCSVDFPMISLLGSYPHTDDFIGARNWTCDLLNTTDADQSYSAYTTCCKVPGL